MELDERPGQRSGIVPLPLQKHPVARHEDVVENGERLVRLFTDVDPGAVGGHRNPMGCFDPLDLSHHLVRGGIDDVDVISGGVRLDDPQLRSLRGRQGKRHRAQNDPSESRETATKHLFVRHLRHPSFQEQVILLRRLSGDQVRSSGDTFAARATSPSLPSQMLSMSTNADPAARRTAGHHRDGNRRLPLRRADA